MNRTPVDSSNIHSIGHDETGLEVQFHRAGCARGSKPVEGRQAACNCPGGDVWHYPGVPAETHAKVITAPSVGAAFHRHVKAARDKTGAMPFPGVRLVEGGAPPV